ncbi:MAG: pantetheine-phosphate adenylyltransferase [Planctomycetaceae bacterium]|nr:pantetheine-phosphate adenylyltransferase [Planctomycetaceae bacterium]
MKIAVYTGSFDPITVGHLNVIQRSSRLTERLIVGVGINVQKSELFTPEERCELIRESIANLPNVEIRTFQGLAVDFVRQCDSNVMIRGVRPLTDIDAEFTMTSANRQLAPEIETVFLMSDPSFSHVSSSLIKQIAHLADDEQLAKFLPQPIVQRVRERLNARRQQASG